MAPASQSLEKALHSQQVTVSLYAQILLASAPSPQCFYEQAVPSISVTGHLLQAGAAGLKAECLGGLEEVGIGCSPLEDLFQYSLQMPRCDLNLSVN